MLNDDQLPAGERAVLERIGLIAGLGEVAGAELALVGDDQAAGLQIVDIGLERGRVHRDQHVGRVAGGLDRGRAEIDLEGGDPEGRALRRADLGREIGEGGEIVAGQRGREGELAAGQLHAVAAVAGEADDDRFRRDIGAGLLGGEKMGGSGQDSCPSVLARTRP